MLSFKHIACLQLSSLLATVAQALAHIGVLYWIMYRLAGDFSITVKQLSERLATSSWMIYYNV